MKWYMIYMCLFLLWKIGFFASVIVELFSQNTSEPFSWGFLSSFKIHLNQRAWQTVKDKEIYLASALESATTDCFFDAQEIAPEK